MGIRSQGSAGAGDASVASAAMGRWHPVGLSFPLSLTHSYTQSLSSPIFLLILTHSLSYTHTISLTPPPITFSLTYTKKQNKDNKRHTHTQQKTPKKQQPPHTVSSYFSQILSHILPISLTHISQSHIHITAAFILSHSKVGGHPPEA